MSKFIIHCCRCGEVVKITGDEHNNILVEPEKIIFDAIDPIYQKGILSVILSCDCGNTIKEDM